MQIEKKERGIYITFTVQLFGYVTPQLLSDLSVSFHNLIKRKRASFLVIIFSYTIYDFLYLKICC